MARVLILRERASGEETARQLRSRGHEPIVLPLEAVVRLDGEPPTAPFDGFAVTSSQAVSSLAEAFAGDPRPVFAVGAATGATIEAAGFPNVHFGSGRAASLPDICSTVFGSRDDGATILYAAGVNRSGSLEAAFADSPFRLLTWEVYDVVRRAPSRDELRGAFDSAPSDAVLLMSQAQAIAFAECIAPYWEDNVETVRLLCLSQRISDALPSGLRSRAEISERPTLPSLFERL
ncbi:uroporphyrinogen-III synthetase [Fulvimarina pelagi HTCC2506]|uniref:Uroporphyrinogen-III synthetase n=2 Tax=Fulvimarina pelagi TaxID=217511 RepID=Q0G4B4_9HYPH|nr:uroporphyrinogen-III synthetase [Fulvimarina pelagi HTCC2506]